jgi:hypothetical protein
MCGGKSHYRGVYCTACGRGLIREFCLRHSPNKPEVAPLETIYGQSNECEEVIAWVSVLRR